jgi:Leucine-rich repeat (LRR) protein
MANIKQSRAQTCLLLSLAWWCIQLAATGDVSVSELPIDTVTAYGLARTSTSGNRILRVSVYDNENRPTTSYYIWGEEGSVSIPPEMPLIVGDVIVAYPDIYACTDLNITNRTGSKRPFVVLVQRGKCTFLQKTHISKRAGAVAMYVYMCRNCYSGKNRYETISMSAAPPGSNLIADISSFFINTNDAHDILTSLSSNKSIRIGVNGYTALADTDKDILETMRMTLYPNNDVESPTSWCIPSTEILLPRVVCDRDRVVGIHFTSTFIWYTTTIPGWDIPVAIILLPALVWLEVSNIPVYSFPSFEDSNLRFLVFRNVSTGVKEELELITPSHLLSLRCTACSIRDIPYILSQSRNLTHLDLSWGQLSGQLTDDIALPYLIVCMLNQNLLTGTVAWLSASLYIETIDISNNNLSYMPVHTFDGLAYLSLLTIDHNEFTSSLPLFIGCTSFVSFSCSHNQFIGTIPASWSTQQLPLTTLQCSHNQIWLDSALNLPMLVYIDMSYNALDKCMRGDFDYIIGYLICIGTRVETVLVAGNRIISPASVDSGTMAVCTVLQEVDLSHNLIYTGRWELWTRTGIVVLDMSYNLITDALPAALQPSIRRLNLLGNPAMRGDLPIWLIRDPDRNTLYAAGNATTGYTCRDMIGTTAQVTIDPDYTDFESCNCLDGSYGSPPGCLVIPTQLPVQAWNNIVSVRDDAYGEHRSREGMSITWKMTVADTILRTTCVWSTDVHFLQDWNTRDTLVMISRENQVNDTITMFGIGNSPNTTTSIVLFGCDVYVTFTSTDKNGIHVLVQGTLTYQCPEYMQAMADGCNWIDNRVTYYLVLSGCVLLIIGVAFTLVKFRVGASLPVMYKHSKEYIHIVMSFLTELIDSVTDTITFASVVNDFTLADFHMTYIICFSLAMVASLIKVGSLCYGFYSWVNAVYHTNQYDKEDKQKYAQRRLTRLYVKCVIIVCEGLPMTILNLYITIYIKMTQLIILSMMWSVLMLGAHIHAISGIPLLFIQSRVAVTGKATHAEQKPPANSLAADIYNEQKPPTNSIQPHIDIPLIQTNDVGKYTIQGRHF